MNPSTLLFVTLATVPLTLAAACEITDTHHCDSVAEFGVCIEWQFDSSDPETSSLKDAAQEGCEDSSQHVEDAGVTDAGSDPEFIHGTWKSGGCDRKGALGGCQLDFEDSVTYEYVQWIYPEAGYPDAETVESSAPATEPSFQANERVREYPNVIVP